MALAEEVVNRDDAGALLELGQGARLVLEALQAVQVPLPRLTGVDRDGAPIPGAGSKVPRQVFLDRELEGEVVVPAEVGDAESAVAEHSADAVAPVKERADGEIGCWGRRPALPAAARTGFSRRFG